MGFRWSFGVDIFRYWLVCQPFTKMRSAFFGFFVGLGVLVHLFLIHFAEAFFDFAADFGLGIVGYE